MKILDQYGKFAFGGASISGEGAGYGFGDISESDSLTLLQHAFDRGVRIFDTAPIYGFGESERRIGKAFASNGQREKAFIISKSGVTWHENKRVDMSNDPKVTRDMLEQSLRDLQSDYIDLFMVHWPDENVDIRKTVEVLAKAKNEGKIKHIGLCNTTPEEFKLASEVDKIEVIQSQFNFFEQDVKNDIFPIVKENDISFMSWGTLDKGILTGRVNRDRKFDKSDCRSWAPWWKAMDKESRYEIVERMQPALDKHAMTGLDFAIHFNLSHDELSTILCGARNLKQLDGVIDSLEKNITNEMLEDIINSVS
ncbi:oxidoreductase, aldo/keto reductase family protein [Halobacteriovorax sp. BALOs_7]|uniref:aldo/keto reductase n=1 Tax=unclassified Halobacteriovorax TaxID=2639665 RepID=UPI000EA135C7|nr:aldo/keto reductase [Halobacteriovorax sp. BALOs_7]AYF45120.1 oxidoreductase, aldo/keto reductase family protein [Halobacteriovorax sp. BALOs_7]